MKTVLLIITGGIAAYKVLDVIRGLRTHNIRVRTILTKGGAQFVTPLSVSALSGEKVYDDLWSLTDEQEMGHIRLARENDLVVIAPASADFMAKAAHGLADDLASTSLLAGNAPVMAVPAMNPAMWENPATQANIATLQSRGWDFIGPEDGEMACGETGTGRLCEADSIIAAITTRLGITALPLQGKTALVTSGPTFEPIDPVRVLANRSSGKQGHAVACALRDAGATVTLVTGPVSLPAPQGMHVIPVETAEEMLAACQQAVPCDIAVFAAAVADWKPDYSQHKLKKSGGKPALSFSENPDILKTVATMPQGQRPDIVIGFCAESEALIDNARRKLTQKSCDAILANRATDTDNPFGKEDNHVVFVDHNGEEDWGGLPKSQIAAKLIAKLA